jgi:hypothetical protein
MKRISLLLLTALALSACADKGPTAVFLSFTESGPEGEYPVRMLVTDKFLRIEDGNEQDGYIVLDRVARTIYSVNHASRTTLVIAAQPVKLNPPRKFDHRVERLADSLPPVDGRAVAHYRLLTNGERCFEVFSADGLLPEALAALREYHQVLAGEQATMQEKVPAGFQSACDLADQVFLPARYLEHGFPVRQVNRAGVTRQLVNYKIGVTVEPRLFELPKDYKQITTSSVRG